jgi:hypothetical protein
LCPLFDGVFGAVLDDDDALCSISKVPLFDLDDDDNEGMRGCGITGVDDDVGAADLDMLVNWNASSNDLVRSSGKPIDVGDTRSSDAMLPPQEELILKGLYPSVFDFLNNHSYLFCFPQPLTSLP